MARFTAVLDYRADVRIPTDPPEKCQNGRTKPPSHHVAPIPHIFEKTLYNVPAGSWAFPGRENSLQLKPPRCSHAVMGRPYWLEEASLSCYNTRHPKAQQTPPPQRAPYGKTPVNGTLTSKFGSVIPFPR